MKLTKTSHCGVTTSICTIKPKPKPVRVGFGLQKALLRYLGLSCVVTAYSWLSLGIYLKG